MQQVWITRAGGPDVLELRDAPDPTPGPGQVLIRVEAAGVNFADLMARDGKYPDAPPLPAVVGYEVAGVIQEVGEGAAEFAAGQPVLALTRFGGYSSHVVVPHSQVFHRPQGMTAEVGAALPLNYLTAFQALVVMGGLRHASELGGHRMRVLVHGAGGGVGTAAADLARIYGAELFGTASAHKLDYVSARGYHHPISHEEDWVARIESLTDGAGVDIILDPLGGESWRKGLDVLAPTGRIVLYGYASALGRGKLSMAKEALQIPWTRFQPLSLINRNQGILGVNLGRLWSAAEQVSRWSKKLLYYYARGEISPHVDRVFPLANAGDAHRYIESRQNVGKVILAP